MAHPTTIAIEIEDMPPNERTPRSMPTPSDHSPWANLRDHVVRLTGVLQTQALPIALAVAAIIVAACKGGGSSGY